MPVGTLRSALNRPQRSQAGSLRLGQSPDPCDIEPLIGSVTPQRAQVRAALQLPDVESIVIPATGQQAAIRAQLERLDRALMCLSHPHALPVLQIPPAQHAIAAPTDQH